MTKNEIITQLFNGKNFRDCIGKMEPDHLREDLRQEVILIICELPGDQIQELYKSKALDFYAIRVILNQAKSNNSPFVKKYRSSPVEITGSEIIKDESTPDHLCQREEREKVEDMIMRLINSTNAKDKHWYHKELVKLYMEIGNYRGISDQTFIPPVSVFKSISEYKATLARIFSEPIYSQKQAAKLLGVNCLTLRKWEKRGLIKPEVRGQGLRLIYTKSEIERVRDSMVNLYNKKNKISIQRLGEDDIKALPPFNARIVILYKKLGNLRAVSQETGVHYNVCRDYIESSIRMISNHKNASAGNKQKVI